MNKYQRHKIWGTTNVPKNWHENILVLWEAGYETFYESKYRLEALERMSGEKVENLTIVDKANFADTIAMLHIGGWVSGYSCGIPFVGVLIQLNRSQ